MLVFLVYGWFVAGLFLENEWIESVTESYICLEACVFIFCMVPIIIKSVSKVRLAAHASAELMRVIDRVPKIKNLDGPAGSSITEVTLTDGIRFNGVTFKYPNAPEHAPKVLEGASF